MLDSSTIRLPFETLLKYISNNISRSKIQNNMAGRPVSPTSGRRENIGLVDRYSFLWAQMRDFSTSNRVRCNSLAYVILKRCLGLKEGRGYDFNCFLLAPKGAVFATVRSVAKCSLDASWSIQLPRSLAWKITFLSTGKYRDPWCTALVARVLEPEEENKHNDVRIFPNNRQGSLSNTTVTSIQSIT